MPEELASYHVPDGEPKHVAPVNLLARLKEAEAHLRAAQAAAAKEAAAKEQAAAAARVTADQAAKQQAKAAKEADRHAKHEAQVAKVHEAEQKLGRKLRTGRAFGVVAVVAAGLAFGLLLIVTYELLGRRSDRAVGPTPTPTPRVDTSEVVPAVPSPSVSGNPATEPVNPANGIDHQGNPIPDRGTPPGQE